MPRYVVLAIAIVGGIFGYALRDGTTLAHFIIEGSEVSATTDVLLEGLKTRYVRDGRYPRALEEVLDEAVAAKWRPSLDWFRYESDGFSYTLVRLGPAAPLQRVWWCVQEEICSTLSLSGLSQPSRARDLDGSSALRAHR